MKIFLVLCLVLILLAVSVVPAFAAGGPHANQGNAAGNGNVEKASFGVNMTYALSGTISAISLENRTVTVLVACGNHMVKPFIGQNVTLNTTEATRFLLRNPDGTVTPISLEQLIVGEKVSSHGTLVEDKWTANRITMGALLNCLP